MNMQLFIDIETIGTEDPAMVDEISAGIKPPSNYSKAETIAAWERDIKPGLVKDALAKTAFDGTVGRVICVGMALGGDAPITYMGDERGLLLAVGSHLQPGHRNIIGHNVTWDIRFLWQRFIVNNVPPPDWLRLAVRAKPWEVEDTMLLWNPDRERKISLDRLCKVLGITSPKNDFDGSMVWDAWRNGEEEKISEYCRADIVATRECYRRMKS
jgi:hypothetical protein